MAGLVKVLQVERVIPHLIERSAEELDGPDLELEDDDEGTDQQDSINASPHARDAEFEEERPAKAFQLRPERRDLGHPGISFCRLDIARRVGELTQDLVHGRGAESVDRPTVPGARRRPDRALHRHGAYAELSAPLIGAGVGLSARACWWSPRWRAHCC